jgi:hypothetical protein
MSVAGLILSNLHDGDLAPMTAKRTTGAVPFGGRYRLIDFPLSAMVGAGISRIYVVVYVHIHMDLAVSTAVVDVRSRDECGDVKDGARDRPAHLALCPHLERFPCREYVVVELWAINS